MSTTDADLPALPHIPVVEKATVDVLGGKVIVELVAKDMVEALLHNYARAALASRDAELAKLRGWRDAVDEALVTAHIGVATEPYDDLNKLLQWHHDIWLDPAVSSDAEALVEQGRAQAAKLRQGEPVAWRYKGAGWERWIYRTDPPRNTQHEYIVEPLYASPPPSQAPAPVPAAQARKALQPLSYHELWASDDLMAVNAEVGFRMQDIIKIARAIERLITERMSAAKETK